MSTDSTKRKMAAILSADVKGYSRLMSSDEGGTVKALNNCREIISRCVHDHSGRVVDSPGDNVLAEFASTVEAVKCAVKIQESLKIRNADLPESRRMEFRIGVNLGDVIDEEGRIYGDGVNIAARLEGLAEAGGICVSGTTFDHVKNKLSVGYQYLGKQTVKNIPDPVRAYKVLMEPGSAGKVIGEKEPKQRGWGWKAVAAVAVLVLVAGGLVWNFYWRAPKIEPASKERMAFPLPERPSIAVLAFNNISGDPKDDLFGDGLAEGIINGLSKFEHIFVIARNSSFTYKGKPVKVKQVAEEMGVRYVIEGSLQREGERVRITVQLIDAVTGHHLFSERYDRDLKGILNLQDEITMKVLTAVRVKLTAGEGARIYEKGTKNLDAYLKVLQAAEHKGGTMNKERVERAMQLLKEAIVLDPEYANAYYVLCTAHFDLVVIGASDSPKESLQRAIELGKKAIALDESNSSAHAGLAFPYIYLREFDKAISEAEKAISLSPNSAVAYFALGAALANAGRPQEAIPMLQKSLRLSPIPVHSQILGILASSYLWLSQYEEAIATYKKVLQFYGPDHLLAHLGLAAAYVWTDREKEARAEGAEVMRIDPKFSLERFLKASPYDQSRKDRLADALRKAGLSDKPPLPLPDKPSIAVLPFVNMSDDKSQEYFSDGLTEEIITALSKTPKLFVIARNSTFVYKGKPVNVQQVGRELGVKYVLEGSVRRSGDQLRITAQLIDAMTGNHLWAERYDREMKDVFAIQDEITLKIINAMEVSLPGGEQAHLAVTSTNNLEAYLKVLQGIEYFHQMNRSGNTTAIERFKEAIAIDPHYAMAYTRLASAYWLETWLGFGKSPEECVRQGIEAAQKAISIDDALPYAHQVLGGLYLLKRDHEKAISEGKTAIILNPNSAEGYLWLGMTLTFAGNPEEAIPNHKMAIRLDPFAGSSHFMSLGMAYRETGRYEEAIAACQEAIRRQSNNVIAHLVLCSSYTMVGREDDARAEAVEVMRIDPKFSLERFAKVRPHIDPDNTARFVDSLRKAGLK
jgi:adenylate cyclase